MKVKHGIGVVLLTALVSCGTSPKEPNTPSDSLSSQGNTRESAIVFESSQDWLLGLRKIASTYPAFAGYKLDRENREIIILVAKLYRGRAINEQTDANGRKLGLIRQSVLNLLDTQNAPFVSQNGSAERPSGWKVKFGKSDASLDDIFVWRDTLFLRADDVGLNLLTFSMEDNFVEIQVPTEEIKANVSAHLTQMGIPGSKVNIRIGVIEPTVKYNNSSQYRPVVGGVAVTMPRADGGFGMCTLGLPVLLNGVTEGYLTAGHCVLSVSSNNLEKMYQDNYTVATKNLDPALLTCDPNQVNCSTINRAREADAVFYKSDIYYTRSKIIKSEQVPGSHVTLQNTDNSDQHWDVTSVPGLPALSEALINIGAESGYRSATVTRQSVDIYFGHRVNNTTVNAWIYNTVEVYNDGPGLASCRGDSGSPWFQRITGTANDVRFFGLQSAASIAPATDCGQYAYFSPVTQIEKHFGAGKITYKR